MEKDAIGSPRAEEHRYKPNLASRPPYNRKDQGSFSCLSCGYSINADLNAARNLRVLGLGCRKSPPELARVTPQPESRLL
jgi:transposase